MAVDGALGSGRVILRAPSGSGDEEHREERWRQLKGESTSRRSLLLVLVATTTTHTQINQNTMH
jgi:hypothetical protein